MASAAAHDATRNSLAWLTGCVFAGIARWDVARAATLEGVFQHAASFNQDVSAWAVRTGASTAAAFKGTPGLASSVVRPVTRKPHSSFAHTPSVAGGS